MYLKNQFVRHRLVLHLLEHEGYETITKSSNRDEILLWRKMDRTTNIVRIALKQFDWARELDHSIEQIERNFSKNVQLPLFQKEINFHHVCIADYVPVDSWQRQKAPNMKAIDHTYVYIWTPDQDEQFARFFNNAGIEQPLSFSIPEQLMELEQHTNYLKQKIDQIDYQAKKEVADVFNKAKPILSYVLIAINIAVFVLVELMGGSTDPETLIKFGAKYNPAMMDGEWWRILSSMFLHIGVLHIGLNMMALYFVGTLVERIFGNYRFLIIYFLAGISGGIASFAFNANVAAGASGALFGLFGALLLFGLKNPKIFFKTIGMNVIFLVILNIIFGLSIQQVDNGAHLGGLIGGFLAAGVVQLPSMKKNWKQSLFFCAYLVYSVGLLFYGIQNDQVQYNETVQLQHIQQLIEEERYQQVTESASKSLPYAEYYQAELLFYRSFANIQLAEYDQAEQDLEVAVDKKPDFKEALYNLALIYQQEEKMEEALKISEKLIELDQDNTTYQTLYQELTKTTN
ncbi:rhomboid family intramembrane serine protease [Gracilibacillus caseinilyticus]|uniref:Rhomboid family intramembrane serine protease n=1 Tax=Gracilibacillus caseinilyticus TaxID=2932256 RepID=A0ABY4ETZ9_9BACI|nr:rhomboid family intramembrane serine protease [Gracilibacillus caseinilyticus]UOQ47450.1 rhomboid family intramembrane serine protease [Gracilibacillus caseinilyticus]